MTDKFIRSAENELNFKDQILQRVYKEATCPFSLEHNKKVHARDTTLTSAREHYNTHSTASNKVSNQRFSSHSVSVEVLFLQI